MKILLIDNNDSFTYNLYHLISSITNSFITVQCYDNLNAEDISGYDAYVISPGPGHPFEYGMYKDILTSGRPVFGVCLGMQIMNIFFGGEVVRLEGCRHGVTVCAERSNGERFEAAVYNSLYCSYVPDVFQIYASCGDVPMWIKHKEQPLAGVQFHPESFLTESGAEVLADAFSSIGII